MKTGAGHTGGTIEKTCFGPEHSELIDIGESHDIIGSIDYIKATVNQTIQTHIKQCAESESEKGRAHIVIMMYMLRTRWHEP